VELRGVLAALPTGERSLFSRTRLVHGAPLFVIDDVSLTAIEDHLCLRLPRDIHHHSQSSFAV
jgi:hypothetical protein